MGEIFLGCLVRSVPRFRISTIGGRGGRRPVARRLTDFQSEFADGCPSERESQRGQHQLENRQRGAGIKAEQPLIVGVTYAFPNTLAARSVWWDRGAALPLSLPRGSTALNPSPSFPLPNLPALSCSARRLSPLLATSAGQDEGRHADGWVGPRSVPAGWLLCSGRGVEGRAGGAAGLAVRGSISVLSGPWPLTICTIPTPEVSP
jgi:hypothetical protein